MAINGVALGAIAIGGAFVYGGIAGKSPLTLIQAAVSGNNPASTAQTQAILDTPSATGGTVGDTTPTGSAAADNTAVTGGSVHQIFQQTAAQFGWGSGAEWQALNNVEMNEAGYNPHARNSSSGALGIAQALGHGTSNTAGTLGNEYGGYGLSDAQAKAANSGDPAAQSLWMMNYMKDRYGDPIATWAQYHHPDGSKWY